MDFDDLNWKNKPYRSLQAYQRSKLCNVLFTKELQRRLEEANVEGVNVYSVHPGIIATELGRHLDKTYFIGLRWVMRLVGRFFIKSPEQGAQTTIYCAVDNQAGQESGLYYSDCKSTQPAKNTENPNDARKLWEISLDMVKLQNYNPFRQ